MKKRHIRTFFKDVRNSLHPKNYDMFSLRDTIKKTIKYFFGVIIFAFLLMGVAVLPQLGNLPNYIEHQFQTFDTLILSGNVSMNTPLHIPSHDPVFIIDTTGQTTSLTNEKVVITNNTIFYQPFLTTHSLDMKEFVQLSKDRKLAIKILTALTLLLLPSIITLMIIFFTLKYLIITLFVGAAGFFILDFTKTKIEPDRLWIMAVHAATPMILIEIITTPFSIQQHLYPLHTLLGMNIYALPTGLFLTLFILGIYYGKKRRGYYHGKIL
jgi:hypothetical protein